MTFQKSFWGIRTALIALTMLHCMPNAVAITPSYGLKMGETVSFASDLANIGKRYSQYNKANPNEPSPNPLDVVKCSLHGGIYATLKLNNYFHLHIESIYTRLGIKKVQGIPLMKKNCVSIPFYCIFYPWGQNRVGFYIGPSIKINIPDKRQEESYHKLLTAVLQNTPEQTEFFIVSGMQQALTNRLSLDVRTGFGTSNIKLTRLLTDRLSVKDIYVKISLSYDIHGILQSQ